MVFLTHLVFEDKLALNFYLADVRDLEMYSGFISAFL